tara:strand:+ start:5074 stop:5544 length:471 start_codon:yes stop_codon:yes gene_type:complete
MSYIKHLVECQCTLRLFKNRSKQIYHKFAVFSLLEEDDSIKEKYVNCNNCDIVHRVYEVNKSEIKWGNEGLKSLVTTKDDIKFNLESNGFENLVNILELNKTDVSDWEYIDYLLENNLEGHLVIEKTEVDNNISFKVLHIKNNKYKIKTELVQRYL